MNKITLHPLSVRQPTPNHSIIAHMAYLVLFAALLILLIPSPVTAKNAESPDKLKELSLEQLMNIEVDTVYGAARYEQKTTDAPSSVSIVTSADIKKFGYRTLADILRGVRGFYIRNDRNYSYVGVRGFGRTGDYNTRICVQIDGHRINDGLYDEALVGEEFALDVDLIDRVEIIRGAGSSLYGSNAFFAVINIITRKGKDVDGLEVSGSAGSYYSYKGRMTFGKTLGNGLDVVVSGSWFDSRGHRSLYYREYDSPSTNNGIARNADRENSYNFFTNLSYKDLSLQGAYVSREKIVPTGSYGVDFNNARNRTTDTLGYVNLKYEHSFTDIVDVTARLYYDRSRYKGDYIYSGVLNRDYGYSDSWGSEVVFRKKLFDNNTIVVGGEYIGYIRQDQKNYDENPYSLYLDDRRHSQKWGVFIQDEFAIHRSLSLIAGMRYDRAEKDDALSPRVGLIYKPFDKTVFKLLYGHAFRAPNAYELYYNDSGSTSKANPNLKAETIRTYEIIYEQFIGDYLRGTVTGFHYRIKNLISQTLDTSDALLVFQNVDSVNSTGVALELRARLPYGIESMASYSYQNTENRTTHQEMTNSPKHLAKANLVVPLISKKLFLAFEEQYTGRRRTMQGSYAGDYFITNVNLLGQGFVKGLEMSAGVYNLFDKRFYDPASEEHRQDMIRQDGINFRLKLTYKF
jgi:outer membrane receptor for ferrienterochelin and colicins